MYELFMTALAIPTCRSCSILGTIHMIVSLLILLALPLSCRSETGTSTQSIYRELESLSPPQECDRSVKTNFALETTTDSYQLIVNIPEKVSRKNLKINIDYNSGEIEVFGWWTQRKIRGENPRKMCVYHRWLIDDTTLMSEEAFISADLVSIYDMVMSLKEQQLILSIPTSACTTSESMASPPPPSPVYNDDDHENDETDSHVSIVIAYGTSFWKKLRGLSRLKDHSRHYVNSPAFNNSFEEVTSHRQQGTMSYLKSRHDALEHFLTHSIGAIDDGSYW